MSLGPGRISRVDIREDGTAGEVEDVAVMDGTLPDGLAFAGNGDLYVVTYRPDAVYIVRRGSHVAEMTCRRPSRRMQTTWPPLPPMTPSWAGRRHPGGT